MDGHKLARLDRTDDTLRCVGTRGLTAKKEGNGSTPGWFLLSYCVLCA